MRGRFLLVSLLSLGMAGPALARDLTAAERGALLCAVGSLRGALAAQDVATVMSLMPPLVVAGMAERVGMAPPDMVRSMADRTAEAGGLATVHSVAVDLDAAQSREADGEPYLLIPTEIVITFPDVGKVIATSHTLAFVDAGEWRLLRLGDAERLELLRALYPRFAEVDLPGSSVEKLAP